MGNTEPKRFPLRRNMRKQRLRAGQLSSILGRGRKFSLCHRLPDRSQITVPSGSAEMALGLTQQPI